MISQRDIAGAVILYNSDISTLSNVYSYINQVHKLYIIDNSTNQNDNLIEELLSNNKVEYHSLNGNKGIAVALNLAAKIAIQDGYTILLTMDDDTKTPSDMISKMIRFWNQYPEPLGILSGVHHNRPATVSYQPLLYTLTSGNLLNLTAYQTIGGFKDELFIDHVDHDYCFRLNSANYQVVELPDIHLDHNLGYSEQIKIGSWVVRKYGTNSPIRLYYYARNGIYVARNNFSKHPNFAWMFTKEMVRRWIKTLFLDDDRIIRMKMLTKGMRDGWNGRLGKYSADENKR